MLLEKSVYVPPWKWSPCTSALAHLIRRQERHPTRTNVFIAIPKSAKDFGVETFGDFPVIWILFSIIAVCQPCVSSRQVEKLSSTWNLVYLFLHSWKPINRFILQLWAVIGNVAVVWWLLCMYWCHVQSSRWSLQWSWQLLNANCQKGRPLAGCTLLMTVIIMIIMFKTAELNLKGLCRSINMTVLIVDYLCSVLQMSIGVCFRNVLLSSCHI